MHLLLLGLFLGVFLHDVSTPGPGVTEALPSEAWPGLGLGPVVSCVLLPKLIFLMVYTVTCRLTLRKLGTKAGPAWIRRTDQLTGLMPLLLLTLYASDLTVGALRWARVPFRHTVLIDELLVMLPTLSTLILTWLVYFPIDRRLRESGLISRVDQGLALYPLPTRGQYVLAQLRHQVALLFVPLLIIAAWSESVVLLGPDFDGPLSQTQAFLLAPAGALGVFLLAPLIIRYLWDTAPLPEGEIRDAMSALCRQHKVKVRELLLWRTYGVLINAAVMGMVGQLRFILLSDALLDQLSREEVEAVMAHEIAHVRKHHMFWMLLVLIAALGLGEQLVQYGFITLDNALSRYGPWQIAGVDVRSVLRDEQSQIVAIALVSFAAALLVFGWVSRRIERQADVFAARHMAEQAEQPQRDAHGRIVFDAVACHTMIGALQRVAVLNHIPTQRKSWRHGSIRWRQDHLRSIIGQPIHDAGVDRVLWRIKAAALAAALLLGVLYWLQWSDGSEAPALVEAAGIIRRLV
ncbi:M48 family metallopeptidase [Phycisphaeraceae bacterium D3-23]